MLGNRKKEIASNFIKSRNRRSPLNIIREHSFHRENEGSFLYVTEQKMRGLHTLLDVNEEDIWRRNGKY